MANEWHFGDTTVKDTEGTAYFQGRKAKEIWFQGKKIWDDGVPWPKYSWWIWFPGLEKQVDLTEDGLGIVTVDTSGQYLIPNDGAVIEKVGVYFESPRNRVSINDEENGSEMWYVYSGLTGSNITEVLCIGFYAYKHKIIILGTPETYVFGKNYYSQWPTLTQRWSMHGSQKLVSPIRFNDRDIDGELITDKHTTTTVVTDEVQKVYSLDALKRYLK